MKFPAMIGKGITFLNAKIAFGASMLIFPLIAVIVVEVGMRYFVGSPTIYAFDLQWMLCGTLVFLGGAYALAENVHVRADILYNMLRKRWQILIDIVLYPVFFFSFMGVLTYASYGLLVNAWIHNEVSPMTFWRPVLWPSRLILFTAMVMLTVQGVVKYISLIAGARSDIRADEEAHAAKQAAAGGDSK
jgi:TRAP-type mannitol/chloroaromatic compound transport system permease small subunit